MSSGAGRTSGDEGFVGLELSRPTATLRSADQVGLLPDHRADDGLARAARAIFAPTALDALLLLLLGPDGAMICKGGATNHGCLS